MTDQRKGTSDNAKTQAERFQEAARELGCDESEERFVQVIKKLAFAPPARNEREKAKQKKSSE